MRHIIKREREKFHSFIEMTASGSLCKLCLACKQSDFEQGTKLAKGILYKVTEGIQKNNKREREKRMVGPLMSSEFHFSRAEILGKKDNATDEV